MLLYGQLLTGRKYVPKANGVVEIEKQWAKQVLPFAFQTVVKVTGTLTDGNKLIELIQSYKLVKAAVPFLRVLKC